MNNIISSFSPIKSRYLQPCEDNLQTLESPPFLLVLLGATGDLSQKKIIPSLCGLYQNGFLSDNSQIIASGRSPLSNNQFRNRDCKIDEKCKMCKDTENWNEFSGKLSYVQAAFHNEDACSELFSRIKEIKSDTVKDIATIYFLAVPPESMDEIIDAIGRNETDIENSSCRIIIEKPFGNDRKSSVKLNRKLHLYFKESQIFRIDHYLGKETVQNILYFRFANLIFESIWNRNFIENIQITVSEDIGIAKRGKFYERVGVIRDVVQNHIMQLIAISTMEPPAGFDADLIRDEKMKVFRSIKQMDCDEIKKFTVCGQYGKSENKLSYREELHVSEDSLTPTFFAGRFFIDNWRWAGVPILVRTGKRLKEKRTEILVNFKHPPLHLVGSNCDILKNNQLVFSIQPREEISMQLNVKEPGPKNNLHPVKMIFNYEDSLNAKKLPDYERLLLDCLRGEVMLFARHDGIDAMWSIVDPIIEYWEANLKINDFPNYSPGSWGPGGSDKIARECNSFWNN